MSKTCNSCKDISCEVIPYVAYESNETRHERREKRLVWLIALLIILLVGTNIAWLIYESSYEEITESYTVEQEAGEENNSIINGGVIN